MSDNVCEAFAKVCALCIARDEAPVNPYPGCWEVQVTPGGSHSMGMTRRGRVPRGRALIRTTATWSTTACRPGYSTHVAG